MIVGFAMGVLIVTPILVRGFRINFIKIKSELEEKVALLEKEKERLNSTIKQKDVLINEKEKIIGNLKKELSNCNEKIKDYEKRIEDLEKELNDLREVNKKLSSMLENYKKEGGEKRKKSRYLLD